MNVEYIISMYKIIFQTALIGIFCTIYDDLTQFIFIEIIFINNKLY